MAVLLKSHDKQNIDKRGDLARCPTGMKTESSDDVK